MINLSDKVALITGAASGIGLHTAQYFSKAGARVIASDINIEGLESAFANSPNPIDFIAHDVSSEQDWQAVFEFIKSKYQDFNILVNNAGIFKDGNIEDMSYEDYQSVFKVNTLGTFLGVKYAIESFRAFGKANEPVTGSVVNVSSMAGIRALKGMGAYCASKAAVSNMTRSIAVECGTNGEFIRINAVNPGTVRTELTESAFGSDFFDQFSQDTLPIPMADYGRPDDIAAAIAFLASDKAEVVTGADLTIDGGWAAGLAGLNL
ncbi:glucose 1-dehydrogenase [Shewanella corallii]|uniref:Glucose 1-dehydrogenase n=1 Tax=Shewanella corallii TaxID=560080 RepID=A0ABT0NAQ6_9GAMM|nr:glucose 1-dehydrogenase [Shewanella corallii]MCL2915509.1 glucose 1-dehydrogenase [Shewanella corallii]